MKNERNRVARSMTHRTKTVLKVVLMLVCCFIVFFVLRAFGNAQRGYVAKIGGGEVLFITVVPIIIPVIVKTYKDTFDLSRKQIRFTDKTISERGQKNRAQIRSAR